MEYPDMLKRIIGSARLKSQVLIIIIFLGSAALRFWDIPGRFIFDIDVQYQALLAWEQVKNFHIIWIGVSASNIGYYLGPGLVYLTALLLKISDGDPVILGYFASSVGVLTLVSLYYITRRAWDEKTALITTVLYGFSYFTLTYDRKFWPLFIPLISIWMVYSLSRAKKNPNWLFLSVFLIAASYHIHVSLLIYWPFLLFTLFEMRRHIPPKYGALLFGVYFFGTLPLLVFDILHNFDNLRMPLTLLSGLAGESKMDVLRSVDYLLTTWSKYFVPSSPHTLLKGVIGVVIGLGLLQRLILWKKADRTERLLVTILGIQILATLMYPGPLQEYYGVLYGPFVIILISRIIGRLPKIAYTSFLILFIFIHSVTFFQVQTFRGIIAKQSFIQKIGKEVGGSPYRLEIESETDQEGWRYLFQEFMHAPVSSTADKQFGWIYQKEENVSLPDLTVVVGEQKQNLKPKKVKSISRGPFQGYIIDVRK